MQANVSKNVACGLSVRIPPSTAPWHIEISFAQWNQREVRGGGGESARQPTCGSLNVFFAWLIWVQVHRGEWPSVEKS